MTIQEAHDHVGERVTYFAGYDEHRFVRYDGDSHSKATPPESLKLG